jgi:hypothetical protein
VTVFNTTPGGGTSNAQTFTINAPASGVAALDNWYNLYTGAPNNTSATNLPVGSFAVGSGAQRVLLVSVVMKIGNNANPTISATYGGTALTPITITANAHKEIVWIGRLNDAQIGSGSKALTISYSGASGNASGLHVKWSSYTGVNQTTPIVSFGASNPSSNNVTFGSAINYVNNGMTTVVTGNNGTNASTTSTLTTTPPFIAGVTTQSDGHTSTTFTTAKHTASGSYASTTKVSWAGNGGQSGLVVVSLQP